MSVKALLFCSLAFLFALLPRLINLTNLPNGAYWDELDAGYQAFSLLKTGKDYHGNPLPLFLHSFADHRTPVAIYSLVPLLFVLGLDLMTVRFNSVIWSGMFLGAIFVLSSQLFPKFGLKAGCVAAAILSLTPWHFHYSRLGLEPISLPAIICVALAAFLRGLTQPGWLIISALFFGLSLYTYSPAKLWMPILLFGFTFVYRREIVKLPLKTILVCFCLLVITSLPFVINSLSGSNHTRFLYISIFTDPTLKSEINTARHRSLASALGNLPVGSSPRLIDTILNNAPQNLLEKFTTNYFSAFSSEFLFTRGDPRLRHSPGSNSIGQLLYPDAVFLILGLSLLLRHLKSSRARVLLLLLLTAPLAASLTRDGAGHASRLIGFLPPLVLLVTLAIIARIKNLLGLVLTIVFYGLFFANFLGYYFTHYQLESAKPFQHGFEKAVRLSASLASSGRQVIIDARNENILMAYLFFRAFDPSAFHQLAAAADYQLKDGFRGRKLGSELLLYPGERSWSDADLQTNTTLFLDGSIAGRPSSNFLTDVIYYPGPDREPAFFVYALPQ